MLFPRLPCPLVPLSNKVVSGWLGWMAGHPPSSQWREGVERVEKGFFLIPRVGSTAFKALMCGNVDCAW